MRGRCLASVLSSVAFVSATASLAIADSSSDPVPVAPAAARVGMPSSPPPGGWMSPAGQAELVRLGDAGVLPPDGTYVPLPSAPASLSTSPRTAARPAAVPPPGFRCAVRAFPPARAGSKGAYHVYATTKNVCRGGVASQLLVSYLQEDTSRGWVNRDSDSAFKLGPGTIGTYMQAHCIFRRDWRARAYGTVSTAPPNSRLYGGFNQSVKKIITC